MATTKCKHLIFLFFILISAQIASAGNQLDWKENLSFSVKSHISNAILAEGFLYIAGEKSYYCLGIKEKEPSKETKEHTFYRIDSHNYLNFDNATYMNGRMYFEQDNKFYTAEINKNTGELFNYKKLFYELESRPRNISITNAYGRFYLFSSWNDGDWYGLNHPTENGLLTRWDTRWLKPKGTRIGGGQNKNTVTYDGKIFYAYRDKTGYIPVREDGHLRLPSNNADLPGNDTTAYARSQVRFNDSLYVLNQKGQILSSQMDDSGTIYEWTLKGMIPEIPTSNAKQKMFGSYGNVPAWLFKTDKGLVLVYYRHKQKKIDLFWKTIAQEVLIYTSGLEKNDQYLDHMENNIAYKPHESEKILKPESQILEIKHAGGKLFAWDELQNKLLISEDNGINWSYSKLSYPHDRRTTNSKSGILKQLEVNNERTELLAILTDGLYRLDLDLNSTTSLTSKSIKQNYYNERIPNKQNFAVNPLNESIILMPIGNSLYKSGNSGKNWLKRGRGLDYYSFSAISYVPHGSKTALLEGGGYYSKPSYFITEDDGDNWIELITYLKKNAYSGTDKIELPKNSGLSKIISPDNHTTFIIGCSRGYSTMEIITVKIDWKNKSIESNNFNTEDTRKNYTGISDIEIFGDNLDTILISFPLSDRSGKYPKLSPQTYRSTNGGKTYSKVTDNQNRNINFFAFDRTSDGYIWGGGLGVILVSADHGESWLSPLEIDKTNIGSSAKIEKNNFKDKLFYAQEKINQEKEKMELERLEKAEREKQEKIEKAEREKQKRIEERNRILSSKEYEDNLKKYSNILKKAEEKAIKKRGKNALPKVTLSDNLIHYNDGDFNAKSLGVMNAYYELMENWTKSVNTTNKHLQLTIKACKGRDKATETSEIVATYFKDKANDKIDIFIDTKSRCKKFIVLDPKYQ